MTETERRRQRDGTIATIVLTIGMIIVVVGAMVHAWYHDTHAGQ